MLDVQCSQRCEFDEPQIVVIIEFNLQQGSTKIVNEHDKLSKVIYSIYHDDMCFDYNW